MEEDTAKPLSNVIKIDDARLQDHLGKIVRGTVEESWSPEVGQCDKVEPLEAEL